MSNSGNILKSGFIQFSNENTRVIDSNALVSKRLEGFSGVFREQTSLEESGDFEGEGYDPALDMLTGDESADGNYEVESAEQPVLSTSGSALLDIQNQCNEMVDNANAEAERIIAEANAAAESIRATARDEGLALGREEAMQELFAAKKELADEKEAMALEYKELLDEVEPQMVDAITRVYEHVFGANFYSRRDVMVCLINKALMHIETNERVAIHVSPDDYDMLVGMKTVLFDKIPMQITPEIIQRDDFEKGQAKIETSFGIVDCGIDTELKELSRALRMLSYEGHDGL